MVTKLFILVKLVLHCVTTLDITSHVIQNEAQKTVYQYQNTKQFVLDWLSDRQKSDPSYSLRKCAKEMGISHSLLVLLIGGKRPIKLKHAPALAQAMKLSSHERMYLQAMIEFNQAKSIEQKEMMAQYMASLNPGSNFIVKEIEEFKTISSWLHMALLEATRLKTFDGSDQFLIRYFSPQSPPNETRAAIERLKQIGLLITDQNNKLVACAKQITTKDDISSQAVRKYHKDVSILAQSAVDAQTVQEREFQSFALAIDPQDIPLAKEMIRKFRVQLSQALQKSTASQIYHVNLQFFRLTESHLEKSRQDEGVEHKNTTLTYTGETYA